MYDQDCTSGICQQSEDGQLEMHLTDNNNISVDFSSSEFRLE